MPIDLYPRVIRCIGKPVENRSIGELHSLEDWFRMKSKLFAALPKGNGRPILSSSLLEQSRYCLPVWGSLTVVLPSRTVSLLSSCLE